MLPARDNISTVILSFQPLPENPVEILTRFTGRNIIYSILVVVITYLLARQSRRLLEALAQRAPRARFFFKFLAQVLSFTFWMIGILLVLSILSPSKETLLAVLVSVGIALGLGSQDLVRNILGGLVILTDRPFQLGDRVRIGDAYGEIDQIGLQSTKLITPNDTQVTIPNGEVLTGKAWNANSGVPDSQVVTDLVVPYDTDPTVALEIGYEAAYSSPYLLLSKPVVVLLQDQYQDGPYLQVRVKAYVYDHRFEPYLQSDVTLRAKAEFLRRGILHN